MDAAIGRPFSPDAALEMRAEEKPSRNGQACFRDYFVILDYFVFSMISMKESGLREAPPIRAPSISG